MLVNINKVVANDQELYGQSLLHVRSYRVLQVGFQFTNVKIQKPLFPESSAFSFSTDLQNPVHN